MRTLATDENNNLYVTKSGSLALLTEVDAVLQSCRQASQVLMGELPYAQSRGIAFFDVGFTSTSQLAIFESQLRTMLLSVPEVTKVVSIGFDVDGDEVSYEAKIQTSYSDNVETVNGNL